MTFSNRRVSQTHKFTPHNPQSGEMPSPGKGEKRENWAAMGFPQSAIFRAFTLIELLVSTAIISLIMLLLVQVTNNISAAWRGTAEKVEKFQEARDAFEAMNRRISQATLNTYWDYYELSGVTRNMSLNPTNFLPFTYGRQSDLRFISGPIVNATDGKTDWSLTAAPSVVSKQVTDYIPTHGIFFQAPLGIVQNDPSTSDNIYYAAMNNLLNTWGYFIEFASDTDPNKSSRPPFLANTSSAPPSRWRGRLMEMREPSENLRVYENLGARTSASVQAKDWFLTSLRITDKTRPTRVMAENIIALIIYPRLSKVDEEKRYPTTPGSTNPNKWSMLAPNYTYDSSLLPKSAFQPGKPTLDNSPRNPGAYLTSPLDASDMGEINPRNQLPPVLTVTMVALDERSAQRMMDLTNPGSGTATALDTTFSMLISPGGSAKEPLYMSGNNPLFIKAVKTGNINNLGDAETVGTDMYAFTQKLVANKLTYRIFSTNVTIRGAKWSRGQVN